MDKQQIVELRKRAFGYARSKKYIYLADDFAQYFLEWCLKHPEHIKHVSLRHRFIDFLRETYGSKNRLSGKPSKTNELFFEVELLYDKPNHENLNPFHLAQVKEIFKKLEPYERLLLSLAYYYCFETKEIAAMMELTAARVSQMLAAIYKKVRSFPS